MSTVRLVDQISGSWDVFLKHPSRLAWRPACDLPFHPVKPQQDKTPAHRHSEASASAFRPTDTERCVQCQMKLPMRKK